MTTRSYLRVFRERWRSLLAITLIGVAVAILATVLSPKRYQADAQVFVTANSQTNNSLNSQYDDNLAVQGQVATFAALIDTPQILAAVRKDLGLHLSNKSIASLLSADAPASQSFVNIHVTDQDPRQASAIANSAADKFISVIEKYKTPTGSKRSTVQLFITNRASTPTSPISPQPILNLAIGLVLGILLGAAFAVTRDLFDNRIKDVGTLETTAGKSAMGVIVNDPKAAQFIVASRAGVNNVRAENFRQLRANLQFANIDRHPRVIAVTSSIAGEGKSMVALNLATTLAETGFTVALVDADLRRPTIATAFALPPTVGLTSVLISQIDVADALQKAGLNLWVLTAGPAPPNPSELLASSSVRGVVRSLLDRVDYVVLDTAPLLPVADGSEVAALADGTLLVARHKMTTIAQVKRARALLTQVDASLLGVVLNRAPAKRGPGGYGYGYYYDRKADQGNNRPTRPSPLPSPKASAQDSDSVNANVPSNGHRRSRVASLRK